MAQIDEAAISQAVSRRVTGTEFDNSDGYMRVVLTFDDGSQLMFHGEGMGYTYRQAIGEPLLTHEQLEGLSRRT